MQPNSQGYCDSYYGTWNVRHKPKLGIDYFMINEHIKKMVHKEKDRFIGEIAQSFKSFNDSMKKLLSKQEEEIKNIHDSIGGLTKLIYKVIDLNKLKEPEIEKIVKKKGKKKVQVEEENEDDFGDGYL